MKMRKSKIYLGGEEIHENEMMPKDFTDFLEAFIRDILEGK